MYSAFALIIKPQTTWDMTYFEHSHSQSERNSLNVNIKTVELET